MMNSLSKRAIPDDGFFRTIVEQSADGLLLVDAEGIVQWANSTAVSFLGGSERRLIGFRFGYPTAGSSIDIVQPDGRGVGRLEMRACAITWEGRASSLITLRDTTVYKQVEEELHAAIAERDRLLVLAERTRLALLSLLEDQKETEHKLAEREHYFRGMMHSLHEYIVVIDRDYRITDVNNASVRSFGRSREEVIGRFCYEVLHGCHEPCKEGSEPCSLVEVFQTGEARNNLHEHIRSDNTRAYVDILLSPLKDSQGIVTRVVEAIRDVTDIIEAREEAKRAHEQLSRAVQAGNVGLWDWDLRTNKVYYSIEWKRQIGWEGQEIGDGLEEWQGRIHSDDLASTLAWSRRLIEAAVPASEVEFRLRHKDGSYRWILCRASIITDETGGVLRALGTPGHHGS